ncbi:MAG: phytanoyl-CoA dioxygenase family protein [Acidobacteriota bacterium]
MSDWAEVARREGFAHRRGLLDAAVITSLRDAVLASLGQHGLSNVVAVQCDIMPLDLVGRLRSDRQLTGALAAILRAEPLPIHADVLRIVGPGETPTPPHRDAEYLSQDPLWIAWIPLDGCAIERGPLVVNASTAPLPLPCSIGDVIFFSSQTVHATLPNTSGATRLSIDFRFTK